ncbi:MAG: glycosyltransferase family 4 protein [Candidatus Uhrbacteria bacterium]
MKILSVSLDRRVLDPTTVVAQRQAEYFRDHEVSYIILDDPKRSKVVLFLSALFKAYTSKGFDVVTTQDPLFSGIIGYVAARRSRAGLQIQDHSGAFGRSAFSWKERLLRPISKYILKRADRVRTVSLRGKNGLIGIGVAENRIDVIPIATDVSRFTPACQNALRRAGTIHTSRTGKEIVCVSRLEKEKGVEILLAAFDRLKPSHPELILTVVGDGSLRTTLDVGKKDVNFVGNQTDVRPYLDRATVYVQPSYFEGWGMAVVEAAASGAPIVMTDVGLAGEVICDEESGLVTPVGDPEALAKAIERVLVDRALGERLAMHARKAVEMLPAPERGVELVREALKASCKKLRLLIITQAVDLDDPVLGFFHHWIEKILVRASVTVICLKRGDHHLPGVEVYSLGKEDGVGRLGRLIRFAVALWQLRGQYDSVFVHMNDVYVGLAGWWWRLTGKHIGLWRNHPQGTWMTPVAAFFSHRVFYTSVLAYTARYRKSLRMPAGIDTDVFNPGCAVRISKTILFFGRLSRIKHPELLLRALSRIQNLDWTARIVGDALPQDRDFAKELHALADELGLRERVSFEPAISQDEAPALFASCDVYVNATPSGSYDKTVIEAMASGCLVAVGNTNFDGEIPAECIWKEGDTESLSQALVGLLSFSVEQASMMRRKLREYAVQRHGLDSLVGELLKELR